MKRFKETLVRWRARAGSVAACLAVVLLALASGACSTKQTGDGGSISKVRYYHLQPGQVQIPTDDMMIAFERRYRQHGALTAMERRERDGHYYTVWWRVDDTSQPVTVRFEYRQKDDATAVRVVEQLVSQPGRSNETRFEITGEPYYVEGAVVAHRVSLVQGDRELVDWKSYLWE